MHPTNEILWKLYQEENTTRTAFCQKLGMKGYSNMSYWLNDKQELSIDQLDKICTKLGRKLTIKLEEK
jgi:hypothetical protein